jgi:hypothetical protein
MIKLSNSCSVAMGELLGDASMPASAGLFLYSSLPDFLCSSLKSTGRRAWVRHALQWSSRCAGRHDVLACIDYTKLKDEEAAAFVWLWQMYNYLSVSSSPAGSRLRSLSCEAMFTDPDSALSAVAEHLTLPISRSDVAHMLQNQAAAQHAKSGIDRSTWQLLLGRIGLATFQSKDFNAARRREELDQLALQLADELQRGLEWTMRVTREHPLPDPLPAGITWGTPSSTRRN